MTSAEQGIEQMYYIYSTNYKFYIQIEKQIEKANNFRYRNTQTPILEMKVMKL